MPVGQDRGVGATPWYDEKHEPQEKEWVVKKNNVFLFMNVDFQVRGK